MKSRGTIHRFCNDQLKKEINLIEQSMDEKIHKFSVTMQSGQIKIPFYKRALQSWIWNV